MMKSSEPHEIELFVSIEEVRMFSQPSKTKIELRELPPDPIKRISIQPETPRLQMKEPEIGKPIMEESVGPIREIKKGQEEKAKDEPERIELNSINKTVSVKEIEEIHAEKIEDKPIKLELDPVNTPAHTVESRKTIFVPSVSNMVNKGDILPNKDEIIGTKSDVKDLPQINQNLAKINPDDPIETKFGDSIAPAFLHRELPQYPLIARRLGKEGKVVLRLTIDENGNLLSVDVVEKAGYGFTEAAVEAVKKSTFLPARRDGKPVASRALLTIRFQLERN